MINDDEMLVGFVDESREHLETIEPDILSLESDPTNTDVINRLFRSVHSIKGGAGFFGLNKLSHLAHSMENLMSKFRSNELDIDKQHIDVLLQGLDKLNLMVDDVTSSNEIDIDSEVETLQKLSGISIPVKPELQEDSNEVEDTPVEETAPDLPDVSQFLNTFQFSEEKLEQAIHDGMNIFIINIMVNHDIVEKGKTPDQFFKELEELGRFIDSHQIVDQTDEKTSAEIQVKLVFATIMERPLVVNTLGIEDSRVEEFELNAFLEECKNRGITLKQDNSTSTERETVSQSEGPVIEVSAQTNSSTAGAIIPSKNGPPKKVPEKKKKKPVIKTEESIRVNVSKLNSIIDLAGELVLVRNQLLQVSETLSEEFSGLASIFQNLDIVTSGLQKEILNTRMQPVSTVFDKFPRLVRELGSKLGKTIKMSTEGNEVELDKTVLEALSDPLTHIIRNTADHGIELPEERIEAGKPEQGNLLLKAFHESGQVIILVKDDGKGIDAARTAQKAFEKELITEEQFHSLSDQEKVNLVFLPGFSTAQKISSVSGRGVGMDVVRSNIESIGGSVELNSYLGEGTTIRMTLPLTMAIVSSLIVKSGSCYYAIPQVNLDELVMLKKEDYSEMVELVQEREVLKLRGNLLPLVSLEKGLQPPPHLNNIDTSELSLSDSIKATQQAPEKLSEREDTQILIIAVGGNKIGLIVDQILGNEEIVVKPMPEYLSHIKSYSGTTILGDGTVAMIIDPMGFVLKNDLLRKQNSSDNFIQRSKHQVEKETQSILIFNNGTEEQLAISIPLIQRVDTISLDQIQHIGDKEYIDYRGSQMKIIRLEDHLPINKPDFSNVETANIIIPKNTKTGVGIVIRDIIDSKTLTLKISEGSIRSKGIIGSTIINNKITILLDLFSILADGAPESIQKFHFEETSIQKTRLLLVEDTPMFQTIIQEYLKSVGFFVEVAENGAEAIEKMEAENFDLILSDIEMPVMNGFQFIKKVREREHWKELPVIAITSLDDDKNIHRGLKAGFTDWLVKLDKQKMLNALQKFLC